MRWSILLATLLLATGCVGSFEEAKTARRGTLEAKPQPTARCITLDDRRQFYGGAAKGSALLGGASGLVALPISSDTPSGKDVKISLAVGGLIMGGIAVTTQMIADTASNTWVAECQ